jgi:hypothetical protein
MPRLPPYRRCDVRVLTSSCGCRLCQDGDEEGLPARRLCPGHRSGKRLRSVRLVRHSERRDDFLTGAAGSSSERGEPVRHLQDVQAGVTDPVQGSAQGHPQTEAGRHTKAAAEAEAGHQGRTSSCSPHLHADVIGHVHSRWRVLPQSQRGYERLRRRWSSLRVQRQQSQPSALGEALEHSGEPDPCSPSEEES